MVDIQDILKKVKQLKPLSSVIHKVLALANDTECELNDLVDLVENDSAITANLLRICNSALMGLPVKVESVQQAVLMLGLHRVAELVLAQNLSNHMTEAQKGYQLTENNLWKFSLASAMLAETLARQKNLQNLPTIYTAALLKDIGKVILHEYVDNFLEKIQDVLETKNFDFIEAEKECIGMDHATLGAIIAKEWNFSPNMIYMIENHHLTNPEVRGDPAIGGIYLADMIAMMVGTCSGIDRLAYHIHVTVFDDFLLNEVKINTLMLIYKGLIKDAQSFFETNA